MNENEIQGGVIRVPEGQGEAVGAALVADAERMRLKAEVERLREALAETIVERNALRAWKANAEVTLVRDGVCLTCGGAVLNSGEHIEPERHRTCLAADEAVRQSLLSPPDGWFVFGHHANPSFNGNRPMLEFWGNDGDGDPIWERPIVDDAWWESLVRAECKVGHVIFVDDGDGTVYACPVCALAEAHAALATRPAPTVPPRLVVKFDGGRRAVLDAETRRIVGYLDRPAPTVGEPGGQVGETDPLPFVWPSGTRSMFTHGDGQPLTFAPRPGFDQDPENYPITRSSAHEPHGTVADLLRPAPTADAAGPTFTERQAAAWPEAVARVNLHDAYAPEDPTAYGWTLNWHEETRPGRGHYLDAQFNDGEHFAQITMDVYGSPVVSVATLDWLHSDGDEDCDCDPCQAEREADDDSAGLTVTDEGVGS